MHLTGIFILCADLVGAVITSVVVVALFCLGLLMIGYAFLTDKIWYSAPLIIFGISAMLVADFIAENPFIPAFWRSFVKNHRD